MKIFLFVIVSFIGFNLYGQGDSPKDVFLLLDKAYSANDFEGMKNQYYQNSEEDKQLVAAIIEGIQMKPKAREFVDRVNEKYPDYLKNEMLGLVLDAVALPVYYKEKAESAEIKIADDKATSTFRDPSGLNPMDFFIKVDGKWYIDPNEGKASSNVSRAVNAIQLYKKIFKEGDELMDNNASQEEFAEKMKALLG